MELKIYNLLKKIIIITSIILTITIIYILFKTNFIIL